MSSPVQSSPAGLVQETADSLGETSICPLNRSWTVSMATHTSATWSFMLEAQTWKHIPPPWKGVAYDMTPVESRWTDIVPLIVYYLDECCLYVVRVWSLSWFAACLFVSCFLIGWGHVQCECVHLLWMDFYEIFNDTPAEPAAFWVQPISSHKHNKLLLWIFGYRGNQVTGCLCFSE